MYVCMNIYLHNLAMKRKTVYGLEADMYVCIYIYII